MSTIVNQSVSAAQLWFLVAAIVFILSIVVGVVTRTNDAFAWAGGLILAIGLAAISLGTTVAGMTINTQRAASIGRQVLAILAVTFGVLTQSVSSLHLPVAISSILAIAGAVIIAIEHYVGDPSTGTPTPAQPVPTVTVGQMGSPVP